MCRFAGRALACAALFIAAWLAGAGRAEAQLDKLISPGALARPHASLEGLANCQKCHEQGRKVTAEKCLTCHKPVADRIARRAGVHAKVTECVTCHVDHAGVDGQLRPFDAKTFDHSTAGFHLDGKHARVAADCAACHKSRSFLAANAQCATCHADVHKPTLGKDCATCHSTHDEFRAAVSRFDHSRAAFQLVGAHRAVPCASCHVAQTFKGVKFGSCTACHKDPHEQRFGATCSTCHTSESWRTRKFDHNKTAFRLVGRHQTTECAACHKQPATKVKIKGDTCATCHADVHRGTFAQDCKACHNENGFSKAPFNHATTRFALTGKHAPLACSACHTGVVTTGVPAARRVADYRGLSTACASCHKDVHTGELGASCEKCHSSSGFKVAAFTHPRFAEFFAGQHAPVACDGCHAREKAAPARAAAVASAVLFKNVTTACATCHRDPHIGQEGSRCEACHSVGKPKFALDGFAHDKAAFQLTGRHQNVQCVDCHKKETGPFPGGAGTAVRYKGVATACRACHDDVHRGQLAAACETCHTTSEFKISRYVHKTNALVRSGFFAGRHAVLTCQACHKPLPAKTAATAIALQFKVDSRCVACHMDVHRGALGTDCINCHRI